MSEHQPRKQTNGQGASIGCYLASSMPPLQAGGVRLRVGDFLELVTVVEAVNCKTCTLTVSTDPSVLELTAAPPEDAGVGTFQRNDTWRFKAVRPGKTDVSIEAASNIGTRRVDLQAIVS